MNECGSKISVDIQCFSTSYDKTHTHDNDTITNNTTVNNLFEEKLGMDGVEFSNVLTRPRVKEIIRSLFNQLSQEVPSVKKNFKIANNFQHKWSNVVAGRQQSEQKLPSMIPTIITSQASSVMVGLFKKACGNKDNKKNCRTNKEET